MGEMRFRIKHRLLAMSKSCRFSVEHAPATDVLLVFYVPGYMNYYCYSTFYIPISIAYSNTTISCGRLY